jgi:phosphomethylpyrimidine synthase
MRITQDLREEAMRMTGMEEKSREFTQKGAELYVPEAAAE